ncbi:MAG: Gfo/Idh/MocA family oxidoreductase [Planctomycetales bacterium]|nr:Gfo/Idh/MocA family oxidoreductase [Planctomycetales bacterium]MBN8626237.1 Gfo/Idh/MocA family oxidoreductase [Planctomycetota bacterium]
MSQARPVSRRKLLQTSLVAGGALALPYYVPARAFGANERIVLGFVGVKNQGTANLKKFLSYNGKLCEVAALCDVDSQVLAAAHDLTKKSVGGPVELFGDYRKLLERKDIDAVVISTPDHWHARMTIDTAEAGKDVYCEKPLTHTVIEGRKMVDAVRKNGRVAQTGSQQRSDARFRQACEMARNGRLGKLEKVLVGIPRPNHPGKPIADTAPPAELNYDLWLGPAPDRAYNKNRVHYNFRFFWDYSGGQMTNFGAHNIDIAHWGMGMDEGGPLSVEGTATFHPEKWHEVTETCRVTFQYPDGMQMIVGQQQKDIPMGATFVGSKGTVFVSRKEIVANPIDLTSDPIGEGDLRLYESTSHHQNFLDCVKSRKLPICDIEIGHRAATACHLGNIAVRTGRKITWDAAKEQIIGDDEAQAMTLPKYRAPWTI